MGMLNDLYLTQYHPLGMSGMILILMVEEICDVKTFYGQVREEEESTKMMEVEEVVVDEYVFPFGAPTNHKR